MSILEPSVYSAFVWLSAILIASLDLVIFLGSRNLSSRFFALLTFLTALWATSFGFHLSVIRADWAVLAVKIEYALGILISIGFYLFSRVYPFNEKLRWVRTTPLLLLGIVISAIVLGTNLIVEGASWEVSEGTWVWQLHPAIWVYNLLFAYFWGISLLHILKKWRGARSNADAKNLKYMFFALSIGIIPPFILNIIFPALRLLKYGWIGPIASAFWVFVVGYSIIKYRQMNVKIVFAEVLVIGMAIIFFVNIFAGLSLGVVGRLITFMLFSFLGYVLIKSVIRESLQRDQLKDLNDNLQKKVDEQTAEIQKTYEIEKRARLELQQLNQNKSDFIIITQHHLRTPLAQVRWYADTITNGLYGGISQELRSAVLRIDEASGKLIKTLNNFLDIAQMKIGTRVLDRRPINLKPIFDAVLRDFLGKIQEKRLVINFPEGHNEWPRVLADGERLRDVFAIFLDNAVRYNVEGGYIEIVIEGMQSKLVVRISNTGAGLTNEEKAHLLKQSFFRGKEAKRVNPLGMGVGLLVAKTIIEAHKGTIECTSIKGGLMTFEIALPMSG